MQGSVGPTQHAKVVCEGRRTTCQDRSGCRVRRHAGRGRRHQVCLAEDHGPEALTDPYFPSNVLLLFATSWGKLFNSDPGKYGGSFTFAPEQLK